MKKAQAAMEYLMTYGWAILIVIIVAAALIALGIFNPATGHTAVGFQELGLPNDWAMASDGSFQIQIQNQLLTGTATHVNVTAEEKTSGTACTGSTTPSDVSLTQGSSQTFTIDCSNLGLASGDTYSIKVMIDYTTTLAHTDSGTVSGTVS